MRQVRKLANLFIFMALTAQPAISETINMFAGVPMGGFGDVASNFFMAQQLKRLRPELEINFLVTAKQLKHMRVLVPTYDSKLKEQTIDGIRIFTGASGMLPRADIFAAFAMKQKSSAADGYAKDVIFPDQMAERPDFYEILRRTSNAPLIFAFEEFYGFSYPVATGHGNGAKGYNVFWNTGPRASGLYVLPEVPTDIPSREDVEKLTAAELGVDAHTLKGTKLAFGYSTYSDSALQYLQMMKGYAEARPGESIAVVIKRFQGWEAVKLPPNLRLIPYDKISFSLTRALTAHSQAPLLVTGDTSMSLAVEFKKPFVYERHFWKASSAQAFVLELAERSAYFAKDAEGGKMMAHALNLAGEGEKGTKTDLAAMGRLFASDRFATEYDRVITAFKRARSVPATLLKAIDAFRGLDRNARPRSREVHEKLAAAGLPTQPSLLQRAFDGCLALWRRIKG